MKRYLSVMMICFCFAASAQNGTEIIMFDIKESSGIISLSNPVNITNHKGYDNQPFFYKSAIYYSSAGDSAQMDIKKYDYLLQTTSNITNTAENEFSPTVTPDQQFISCILQRKSAKQDLVKYPLKGGTPVTVIDNLKVGYHTWIDNNSLLLFVLEDTATVGLHYYNTVTKEDKKVTDGIGRGLNKIPGKNEVSFIQKSPGGWWIKKYDAVTKQVSNIMEAVSGSEFLAWTNKGLIIMSNGSGIYFAKPGSPWTKVVVSSNISLKNISRIAINEENTKLAVVVAE